VQDEQSVGSRLEVRFEAMVRAFSGDLFRYALFLSRDRSQAEDLTQEAFLRAWRSLSSLREESKAKSWLFTTVRREYLRQFERFQPPLDELDPERMPEPRGNEAETMWLRRLIERLPMIYKEPLMLQVIGGFSGNEIAQMLDIPRATVNTRLFRARVHLRQLLDGRNLELRDDEASGG